MNYNNKMYAQASSSASAEQHHHSVLELLNKEFFRDDVLEKEEEKDGVQQVPYFVWRTGDYCLAIHPTLLHLSYARVAEISQKHLRVTFPDTLSVVIDTGKAHPITDLQMITQPSDRDFYRQRFNNWLKQSKQNQLNRQHLDRIQQQQIYQHDRHARSMFKIPHWQPNGPAPQPRPQVSRQARPGHHQLPFVPQPSYYAPSRGPTYYG